MTTYDRKEINNKRRYAVSGYCPVDENAQVDQVHSELFPSLFC